jgi:hypothetical protein
MVGDGTKDIEAREAKEYDAECEREVQGVYTERKSSVNAEKAFEV